MGKERDLEWPSTLMNASWLSKRFFFFIHPVIRRARQEGTLTEDEVPEHTTNLDTNFLASRFETAWDQQQHKPSPSIVKALLKGNVGGLVLSGLGYITGQALTLTGPLLLKQIVQGLTCRQTPELEECSGEDANLYLYSCGLFLAPLLQSFMETNYMYKQDQLGLTFRNTMMGLIYRKTLRLNNASLSSVSTGKIVTLMSNDAQKLQDVTMSMHMAWGSPIVVTAILVLLYQEIQWAALVGLAAMIIILPCSATVGKKLGVLRMKIVRFTDKRMTLMDEIVNGIRVIKFYAWEEPFRRQVQEVRDQEARLMRWVSCCLACFGLAIFTGPVLVALSSFAAYTLAGNTLTPAKAYTSLALFTLLRFPLGFLPSILINFISARIALTRIEKFLREPEVSESSNFYITSGVQSGEVEISNGNFVWEEAEASPADNKAMKGKKGKSEKQTKSSSSKPVKGELHTDSKEDKKATLQDISLKCTPGSLTMVVGSVGSGKSSLLATITQQISRISGSVKVGGKLAYVPQAAWIMNTTLRENVLLGAEMDEERYEETLRCTQLAQDLMQLPSGDLTEIGERGVTLSGGQKQRVSIARAVYADADIVLMDDPLSAVDAHVGRALFEQCIRGALRNKTVLLVTNALHFLHAADQVVWIVDGKLQRVGTYKELSEDAEFMEVVGKRAVQEDVAGEAEEHTPVSGSSEGAELPKSGNGGDEQAESSSTPSAPSSKDNAVKIFSLSGHTKGLTGKEERTVGSLSWSVVSSYIAAGGGILWVSLVILNFTMEQGAKIMNDLWLGFWTSDRFNRGTDALLFYLGTYACLGFGFGLFNFVRYLQVSFGMVRAAVNLHNQLLDRVLRLPVSFFDTNPSGRVIGRFSRDTEIMDSTLQQSILQVSNCVSTYLGILFLIFSVMSTTSPWFLILLPPITLIYFLLQRYYIPAARELQRLEAISRSPIYSGFSEAVNGITSIRAYARESHFVSLEDNLITTNGRLYLTQRASNAWLSVRLDLMGLIVLTTAGLVAVSSNIRPYLAGLVLTYALDLSKFLKFGTTLASKAETDFNSVERIVQYLQEKEEADSTKPDDPPEHQWPQKGALELKGVTMRYRPQLPPVLRSVTFTVNAGEHVGIVGRTGSGKSSLFLTIFRIVEIEAGAITIDGVNIADLGLATLRKSLSMIPQDPFMFSGTVRRNLDPFEEFSDAEVWQALESVSLKPVIQDLDGKLQATVSDNGSNFSQGQRQLFCLARALLRNSKVLMMDEATASVDAETDALIQSIIRSRFAKCTVLTIAHRLNTIMDSDRVLVMDAGSAAELDTPHTLLQNPQSQFGSLVEKTGKHASKALRQMALDNHHRRASQPDLCAELHVPEIAGDIIPATLPFDIPAIVEAASPVFLSASSGVESPNSPSAFDSVDAVIRGHQATAIEVLGHPIPREGSATTHPVTRPLSLDPDYAVDLLESDFQPKRVVHDDKTSAVSLGSSATDELFEERSDMR